MIPLKHDPPLPLPDPNDCRIRENLICSPFQPATFSTEFDQKATSAVHLAQCATILDVIQFV